MVKMNKKIVEVDRMVYSADGSELKTLKNMTLKGIDQYANRGCYILVRGIKFKL